VKIYVKAILLSLLMIIQTLGWFSQTIADPQSSKKILYLNSYHEGYKWSDDVTNGVKSGLAAYGGTIDLQIEYMDTQRVADPDYITKLLPVYIDKFKDNQFDVIIASDDAAFKFLLDYGNKIFPDIPVVFCGVNYFESSVEIIKLDGKNLDEIVNKAQNLSSDSLILYFIYSKDNENNYFPYYEAISRIEKKSSVPIYGVWDFTLGYGIVGGKLVSGYYQGESAAKIAIRVLNGEKPSDIPVVTVGTTKYMFDNNQLKKFGISVNDLPAESTIINLSQPTKKQILILNSYNKGLEWTDDMETGIKNALSDKLDNITFSYEYMDIKNNTDPTYIQSMYEYIKNKYTGRKFDVIIATDDQAFNFMTKYHDVMSGETPVVFAGVNYFDDTMLAGRDDFTGVVEAYDLKSTIDVALKLQPNTKNIVVINDTTLTGTANRKNLDKITPSYTEKVAFEYWDNLNMIDIQKLVKTLEKDTIILLLSFNTDKSHNNFSYDESIKLISENAKVPIYGVWDFYLGKGLMGGMLTSGIIQGETAGKMVSEILDGQKPSAIKVVKDSTNMYMFDYLQLKKFGISTADLPPNTKVINTPYTIEDYFAANRPAIIIVLLIISLLIIISLIAIVLLLNKNIRIRRAAERREKIFAMTDPMTEIPNRRAGFEYLKDVFEEANRNETIFTICYMDIDSLKKVNDIYGHQEGDILIKTVCQILKETIRNEDFLCRLGGDEFLVIFPKTNLHNAAEVWKRVERAIDDNNLDIPSKYNIYLSAGFAEFDKANIKSVDELIGVADHEMYNNKLLNKKKHLSS